jgi:hypothetical protein
MSHKAFEQFVLMIFKMNELVSPLEECHGLAFAALVKKIIIKVVVRGCGTLLGR